MMIDQPLTLQKPGQSFEGGGGFALNAKYPATLTMIAVHRDKARRFHKICLRKLNDRNDVLASLRHGVVTVRSSEVARATWAEPEWASPSCVRRPQRNVSAREKPGPVLAKRNQKPNAAPLHTIAVARASLATGAGVRKGKYFVQSKACRRSRKNRVIRKMGMVQRKDWGPLR